MEIDIDFKKHFLFLIPLPFILNISYLTGQTSAASTSPLCTLLGPDYPIPANLCSQPAVQSALSSLNANLTTLTTNSSSTPSSSSLPGGGQDTHFSINVFSTNESGFQFHHTAPGFQNSTLGVKNVTGDSIYRVGSVSKLLTMYTWLVEIGDAQWNDPITKYVPELASHSTNNNTDITEQTTWNDVTIGALATHLGGIGRDYEADILSNPQYAPYTELGLPPADSIHAASCLYDQPFPNCTKSEFLAGLSKAPPVFASFSTPIYSNNGYTVLSYALETITGRPFNDLMQNALFTPLGLTHTSATPPNSSAGVIPGDELAINGWDTPISTAAGGIYSSANDMARIGRAIMSSELLSKLQTRRWMKPYSHTAANMQSVGAPWEILRAPSGNGDRLVDLYTKAGNVGEYASIIVLSPDYGVGYVVLAAGGQTDAFVPALSNIVGGALFPALEAAVKQSADNTYSGIYSLSNATMNTSLELTVDDGPGLLVKRWISNSTDVFGTLGQTLGAPGVEWRLLPTNLATGSKEAWRVVRFFPEGNDPNAGNTFYMSCTRWTEVDALPYGTFNMDEFVFDLADSEGWGKSVNAVESWSARVKMQRTVTRSTQPSALAGNTSLGSNQPPPVKQVGTGNSLAPVPTWLLTLSIALVVFHT